MSEAERPVREWRFYVDDMIGFAEKVLSYPEGMDRGVYRQRDHLRCRVAQPGANWRSQHAHTG